MSLKEYGGQVTFQNQKKHKGYIICCYQGDLVRLDDQGLYGIVISCRMMNTVPATAATILLASGKIYQLIGNELEVLQALSAMRVHITPL